MRLIKKHSIGGIAEAVDSELDKLGTWGKLGVQVIDPTGITGWKDFGDSLIEFLNKGTLGAAGGLALATLGIIPMVGGFGRSAKAAKEAVKAADAVSDTSKATKVAIKAERVLNKEYYSLLKDPLELPAIWMLKHFTQALKDEAIRICFKEIDGIVKWCKNNKIKRLPKKLEAYVDNYTQKIDMFRGKTLGESSEKMINTINYELKL